MDLHQALQFEKHQLPVEDYLEKVNQIVERIMRDKLDKNAIWKVVLHSSLNDKEMKKKLIMKKLDDPKKKKKQGTS